MGPKAHLLATESVDSPEGFRLSLRLLGEVGVGHFPGSQGASESRIEDEVFVSLLGRTCDDRTDAGWTGRTRAEPGGIGARTPLLVAYLVFPDSLIPHAGSVKTAGEGESLGENEGLDEEPLLIREGVHNQIENLFGKVMISVGGGRDFKHGSTPGSGSDPLPKWAQPFLLEYRRRKGPQKDLRYPFNLNPDKSRKEKGTVGSVPPIFIPRVGRGYLPQDTRIT